MKNRPLSRLWKYLQEDSWGSWILSLIIIVALIWVLVFPTLSFITQTPLPIVVVESCSMYHSSNFENWWSNTKTWYEKKDVTKAEFQEFPLKNGLNKGDIVFVWGRSSYQKGDIVIFTAETKNPIIHRIISESPTSTKGDANPTQLSFETSIPDEAIIGKAVGKIPFVGWIKLIFFEPLRSEQSRFCSENLPTITLKNSDALRN